MMGVHSVGAPAHPGWIAQTRTAHLRERVSRSAGHETEGASQVYILLKMNDSCIPRAPRPASWRLALASGLVLATLAGGCSTLQHHGTVTVATAGVPGLKPGDLRESGIAFITPSTVTGQEQDRSTLSLIFTQVFSELRPETRVSTLGETLGRINGAGMAEEYKRMLAGLVGAELLDRQSLADVARVTGVRYVAQLKMAAFRQESQDRFGFLGLHLVDTRKANIRLSLQIWNSADGTVAWEGAEELYLAVESLEASPISFRRMVETAAREIIGKIP